jgi:hypothetical protein
MGALLVILVVALLLLAAGLQLGAQRRWSCWLLSIFPAFACIAYIHDLVQGSRRIGPAAYQSDRRQLIYALAFLAFSIFTAWRSQWRWLFWIEWIFHAIACGVLVYLVFFWKVFN